MEPTALQRLDRRPAAGPSFARGLASGGQSVEDLRLMLGRMPLTRDHNQTEAGPSPESRVLTKAES